MTYCRVIDIIIDIINQCTDEFDCALYTSASSLHIIFNSVRTNEELFLILQSARSFQVVEKYIKLMGIKTSEKVILSLFSFKCS